MGPGDPFQTRDRDDPPYEPASGSSPRRLLLLRDPGGRVALLGLILGALFGAAVLLDLTFEAFFILFCAGMGGAIAWFVHGFLTGRLHPLRAWRTLRGE